MALAIEDEERYPKAKLFEIVTLSDLKSTDDPDFLASLEQTTQNLQGLYFAMLEKVPVREYINVKKEVTDEDLMSVDPGIESHNMPISARYKPSSKKGEEEEEQEEADAEKDGGEEEEEAEAEAPEVLEEGDV